VRHPGVGKAISRDFELMVAAASVAEFLPSMRRLRLRDSLKQFAAPLQEQVPSRASFLPAYLLTPHAAAFAYQGLPIRSPAC
jgi:hypothetical protein